MVAELQHADRPVDDVEGDDVDDVNEEPEMMADDDVLEEITFDDEDDMDEPVDEDAVEEIAAQLREAFERQSAGADDDEDGEGFEDIDEEDEEAEEIPNDAIAGFYGHTGAVYTLAVDPTGTLVATGGGDDKAYVWRLLTGEKLLELAHHSDSLTSVAFNVDGKLLATGGMDGVVNVYDIAALNPTPIATMDGPDEITVRLCKLQTVSNKVF